MKKLILVCLLLGGTMQAETGLHGAFKQVCEAGVCILKKCTDAGVCVVQKNAAAIYEEYKKNVEPFLLKILREVTAPLSLDLEKVVKITQKMKADQQKLKKDLDLLAKQAGQEGNTYNEAKKLVEALDRFDDQAEALKKVDPPYSNTELITAITGVPSAIEWLWGGRSQEVKKHFDAMIAEYAIVRDTIPKLDLKTLVERAQIVISELVYLMDDITDMRLATGKIGDTFISPSMTTNFRALREDFARVTARLGTIVQYKSYVVGGPYDNTTMAKKVGTALVNNIYSLGSAAKTLVKIKDKINEIKVLSDTLKEEGKIVDDKGKRLEQDAQIKTLIDRIKARINNANILEINRVALEEIQKTINALRTNYQDIILLALTMIDQIAEILDHAQVIGTNTDAMMGGQFVQPMVLENIRGMSDDLRDIRKRSEAMIRELKLLK